MINTSKQVATIAAKVIKTAKLRAMPGMDEIAVRLNSEPTYSEVSEAIAWQMAFQLAERKCKGWNKSNG